MSSSLFNTTISAAHRIAQGIMHLPPEIARRVAYRVSPAEFDQIKWEGALRERIMHPPSNIPDNYLSLRVLGIKVLVDSELTEVIPVLKDYARSG